MIDLAVVAQDPNFGGGARAHLDAFVQAARELGRNPEVLYVPHPTLRPELRASAADRVETLRLVRGSGALLPRIRDASSAWVVATVASHGVAAAKSRRPYSCWLATSLGAENAGRRLGLRASRRFALMLNEPFVRRLERDVLDRASAIYAISASSRDEIAAAAGIHPSRVGIIPIPIDLEAFAPEDDEHWLRRLERPIIAFVGRADDPRKNIRLLLDALPQIRREVPGATVQLIGRNLSDARLPAGVEALGMVDDLPRTLREASLFVLPSHHEGFGIAAAEALACGIPVITTRSGGPEELVGASGGGILLDGFTSEELASRAVALLADGTKLLELRRRGRAYVEREHQPARTVNALAEAGLADS